MLESLFNTVAGLKTCNLIKKRLQHSCVPLNIANFLEQHFKRIPLVAATEYILSVALIFLELSFKFCLAVA